MTLSELLSNEELRQHEFPVAREKVFLAHAGVCPLPRRVAEAVKDYVTRDLFEALMADEEDHIDFLETQLDLVAKLGLELYAQHHIGEPDEDE